MRYRFREFELDENDSALRREGRRLEAFTRKITSVLGAVMRSAAAELLDRRNGDALDDADA